MWPLFFLHKTKCIICKILIAAFLIPSKHSCLGAGITTEVIQHFTTTVHYVRLT